ncbi:diacylglycerol kinase family protein [Niallia sp. NCCP-28]|uniref:diacylglycerol/lipid kinase family protein n=1 Tax=Niallia sp. NCCP-28 TaxID=2934712 RepID=UPI0020C13D0D|nr:diacylglycerol kinase family protein [Niallia sp. NCCP-28]
MKYKKGLFLYNGNAGNQDIHPLIGIIMRTLSRELEEVHVYQTSYAQHAKELCRTFGEEFDLVIILGGDGTIHECINGLSSLLKRPTLAILPGGTCNDFSRSLNISQNIEMAIEELMRGEEVPVDIGKVNEDYFLNFFGIGLVAEASNNIRPEEKNILGKASYLLSAVRTLKQANLFFLKIEADGKVIETQAAMVLVANGKYLGGKLLPFQAIDYMDGYLDVFIIKNPNFQAAKDIMAMRKAASDEIMQEEVIYQRVKEVKITAEENLDVDMDGEIYTTTPSNIKMLPGHLRFLTPVGLA